ncbi:uncharacterized protein fndc7rs1 [Pimephales promelas]|uniref:uncharacterized protein fndc7rs1 n=1 Tax=Pimephales promelas TaxID=90988 RepID=UPI0019558BD3|nr:uncharacterized protein fndc7rs1 [Pimephales promelas]
MSVDCTGQRSEVRRVKTAPCAPQSVVSQLLDCQTGDVQVSWQSSNGAQIYYAQAKSTDKVLACNSTSTSCVIAAIGCGQTYNITVSAEGNGCRSNSVTSQVTAAPCPPLNIQSRMNCGNNSASVSWSRGNGELSFLTTLECSNGQTYLCRTNETGCDITNMMCGQTCSVKLVAEGRSCNSSVRTGSPIITAPCPNTGIQARLDCRTNSALISWTPGNGTLSSNATLQSFQDAQKHSCFTNGSSCNISSLQCGQHYNISVTGYGQNCSTCSKPLVTLDTAPCVPTQVNVSISCGSETASVSWAASSGLVSNYIVTAEGDNGITHTCNSSSTSCNISGLACGQAYNVSVTAMSVDCTGQRSEVRRVQTAPCAPQSVVSQLLDCQTGDVQVSWQSSNGAQIYYAQAKSTDKVLACNSTSTSCVIAAIGCGQTYNITVSAEGNGCRSNSVTSQVTAAPCPPLNIQSRMNCGNNSASVSWSRGNGELSFLTTLECSNGQTYLCRTNETGCDITNMMCGQTCSVKLVAEGRSCNSSVRTGSPIITAPCPNTGIQARLDCRTNSALISWTPGNGTLSSNATLQSFQDAQKHSCFTNGSSCNISSLQCGQHYNISVTGYGQNCSTCSKPLVTLDTAPCVPTQVNVSLSCGSETASVSWAASSGLVSNYIVTAEGDNGITHTCNSSSTSCNISGLACGQVYNVSVTAMSVDCTGQRSEVRRVNTAPCAPQSVVSQLLDCQTGDVQVRWQSSNGAQIYYAQAKSTDKVLACNSTSTSCVIAAIGCGQTYNITVSAEGNGCRSNSVTSQVTAAPCPNTGIQARLDCRTNSALISWTPGNGTLSSNATLQSFQDAQKHSCFTNGSSCNISSLQCGQHYNISVTGYGQNCSTCSKPLVTLDTAPCVPTQVNVSLSCGSDTASVSWAASSGLVSNYIVTAEGDNGITHTCNSSSTSCNISGLACGQAYNVSVTAMSVDCTGQRSEVRRVQTAPCAPQSVVSQLLDCQTGDVQVSWQSSNGAQIYYAQAKSTDKVLACNSTSTSCVIAAIGCGQTYNITVSAEGNGCRSNSVTSQVTAAPCPPLNIQSRMNCGNNSASVSWSRGNGELSFLTTLECSNGQTYLCRTNETGCDITNMMCGQTCSVKLVAEGRSCNSSVRTGSPIITAPCPNTGIQARLDCRTNSALISWTPGNGTLSSNATLQSFQDAQKHSCFTNGSSCNISSLQCGQHYNISVTGYGQNCSTCSKPLVTLDTAPCVPTQVNVSISCGSETASVSWAASSGLVSNYIVTAEGDNGITHTCNSSSTSCNISGLACGQAYNVSVTAMSVDCTGQRSEVRRVQTAPCAPQSVVSQLLDCQTGDVQVSWQSSNGAQIYYAQAKSTDKVLACNSTSTSCVIAAIGCGQTYNITVSAEGNGCRSNSVTSQVTAAPCPPLNIQSRMNCGNNSASVSWSRGNGELSFLTTLECSNGQTYLCRTNETGCDITNMMCGQTCSVKLVAEGRSCNSSVRTGSPIITAPCPNTGIQARLDCRTNSALISWTPGNGTLSSNATLQSFQDAQKHSCFTNGSSCNISSLQCGQHYNISVTGYGQNCSTCSKPLVTLDTAPCVPTQVNVSISCGSETASVSWAASSGLVSNYIVTAEGDNGITHTCNSSSTSCNISGLACGQAYNVSVTAMSVDCTGQRSEVRRVQTAPCAPQSVVSQLLDCQTGDVQVSWQSSNGAQIYYAQAKSTDKVLACNSTSTSCVIAAIGCGQTYNITVSAEGNGCRSNSVTSQVTAAPCPPLNIQSRMNCGNNSASVSWSRGNGELSFLTTLECSNGQTYLCRTNETGCDITNMMCGQTCSVKLVAEGRSCNSSVRTGSPIITAPCPNTGIQARLDCRTNSALISWTPGNGTLSSNATLQSFQDAQKHSCFTNGSSCNISSLQCGQHYNISVTGYGQNCSTCSKPLVTLDTAPCVPTQVNVSISCGSETASVSWAASSGLVSNYIVTAEGDNGITHTCNSSSTSCNISGLACGQAYNVSVTAMSVDCTGQRSEVRRVKTAPCAPQSVVSQLLDCQTGDVQVSWQSSNGAQIYYAQAKSTDKVLACNSTSTSCVIAAIGCGQTYNITVSAEGNGCRSNSVTSQVTAAPCPPLNIQSRMNCGNNSASVSWSRGNGELSFLTTLECSNGQTYLCRTNETGCDITNMMCGQTCSVKLVAEGRSCNSSVRTGSPIITAPCPNTGIQARLDCRTNSALISWTPGNGTLSSNATLQSFQDAQKHSCFTNGSSCNISSLQCGQHYNISVTGYGQNCSTCSKPLVTLDTAPCVPTQVNVSISCGSETASVSWAASSGLVSNYIVTAEGDNGITHTCNSSSTSCNISGLACGQAYNVSVTAMSVDCTGQRSEVRRVKTAPCVPQNVSANVTCSSNIAKVTWASSQGAELYSVTASSVNGLSANCTSASTSCDLLTLTCGQSYTITVKAKGSNCSSGNSAPVQVQTVPCVPGHVQGRVNCTTGDVSLSWDRSVGAVSYTAVAWSSGGYASTCNSTGTACVFSDLLCGMNYSLAVSASDSSCRTAPTQPVVLNTVSCKPQNASALLNCDTNSAVVTWELTDNLTHHTVQAVGSDGHRINCTSSDHSCTLSGIHCGQRYNLTVTAMDGVCDNSNTYLTLQSAPCAPSNVQTSLLCDINNGSVVSVSWVQANGAEAFMAVAVSNDGHSYSCNTTTFSCNLKELQCGQNYNVSVYSMASGCGGVKSTMSQVQTAPCPPHNVSANVQCDSGSVLVSWSPAVDASQFRVEMESEITGVISSCNSTNTQCSITHLPCGESFNISVVALRGSCQSQASSSFNIASAPCAPQGVNGTVDCVTNSAWVSWEVDKGVESYTVLAVGDDGLNTTCSSANSTCNVPDLGCGKSYTFQVTASNGACLSPPSNSLQLETAPCALSSIVVVAECQSSVIMVQWQRARRGNSLYIVTAEDQDRAFISCNSSTSSCNLTNVQCGKEYTIIVAASANQCSSLRSPPYKIRTAPCQPSQVQAYADCESKAVFVSWEPSYVAQSYLLTAVSRDGDLKTCNTSYNNCTLTDMQCSNTYNVSVLASNENCTSVPSTNVTFKTVPCAPTNVTANIQCGNSSASLSWVGSTGAVAYVGIAQSENASKVYCQNTETSCSLMGLVCGTVYNFTVQATDGTCNSSLSKPQIGGAAPCPPAGLRVVPRTVVNDTQILRASWSTVSCPNSEYLFGLKGSIQGNSQALFDLASYWTSRTFFEMPLPCGSSYSATIRARNSAASSAESVAVTGTTVPCAPLNVTFSASSAVVAWQESLFATNYTAYGVTSSGRMKLCMTSQLLCSITSFSSGHIVVTAHNAAGQSEDSVPVLVTAVRRR